MSAAASRTLTVATRNRHKLDELREILPDWELHELPGELGSPEETGETFVANALIKARAVHERLGGDVIADDSGIAARALGGRPGVRSARFAGEGAGDEENLARLIEELRDAEDRAVAYVCVIALITAAGDEELFEGRCEGILAARPRGSGGFGYDPAFVPVEIGDGRTMAELAPAEKHAISHRGRAARLLAERLGAGR
jgi:XTP/dITP diphosphohydrolase